VPGAEPLAGGGVMTDGRTCPRCESGTVCLCVVQDEDGDLRELAELESEGYGDEGSSEGRADR